MYEVVGCGACRELWIREGEADTATCPRCGKQHQVRKLRTLAQAETAEAAREARSTLLVTRDHDEDGAIAGYAELEGELESAGMPDETYLTAHGIDVTEVSEAGERATVTPARRSRQEIVRMAIREAEAPTEQRILETASEHGIEAGAARAVLEKLLDGGHAVKNGEEYRLL